MLRVIFRPIKDSLKRVQSATKDRIKSQKERARVMKGELVTIGNFIESLSQEEEGIGSLGQSFWGYVATFWPLDPRPPGGQLEAMYKRILEKEAEEAAAGAGGIASNGTTAPPNPEVKDEKIIEDKKNAAK